LREQIGQQMRMEVRPQVEEEVRAGISREVKEELRQALWNEVREEVKEDLRIILQPALAVEIRDQLNATLLRELETELREEVRKQLREELLPELREQVRTEAVAQTAAEAKRDPEYYLNLVRDFLFPDHPEVWSKARHYLNPEEWELIVAASERHQDLDPVKLGSIREVMRESLLLKIEIEKEIEADRRPAGSRGGAEEEALRRLLLSADEVLDQALQQLTHLLKAAVHLDEPQTAN
jgi:hypothetical protein